MYPTARLVKWIWLLACFFLVVMTILRLVSWFHFKISQVSFISSLPLFWLGFRYDARVVSIVMVVMLLFGCIPLFHPFLSSKARRFWTFYLSLFAGALITFYIFDFLHFSYLSQRLNASALSFLQDARISSGMVMQTYPVFRILIGMLVGLYLFYRAICLLYHWVNQHADKVRKPEMIAWFIGCFFLCSLGIFGRFGQYPLRWSDAFNTGSDFSANIALNPFQSFFSSMSFRTSTYNRAKVEEYYGLMSSYLGVDHPGAGHLNFKRKLTRRSDGISTRPNVIIVLCESFSAYKSSMWGNPLNTTPFFKELCSQGIFFDNCFTPHFGTARGVWSTITGIPDVELSHSKSASRNPAMVNQHTIVNDFQGYEKFYFLGGSTSWANIRGLLTNNIKGLHLYEEGSYKVPKINVWGISDKNLFLEANKVLSHQINPFIAIIQTADNHRPYSIAAEDLPKFIKVNLPVDTVKRYGFETNDELNAFRYTDFCYREFIETARKSAYFENTIFVFVGDHGINGNAGEMLPPAWTVNGLTGFHVPLLFYGPRFLKPQVVHEVASQVDVLPTVAGLANIDYTNSTLGRDLLDKRNRKVANMAFIIDHNNNNKGLVKGDYYYIQRPSGREGELVWANYRQPVTAVNYDTLKTPYAQYTSAFFETARYMLLNNKKEE